MLYKSRPLYVLATLLLLTSSGAAQFSFQGIGDFGSGVVSISSDGRIVAGSTMVNGISKSALWTPTTGTVQLGNLPGGGSGSSAFGISFDGSVIVGNGSSANGVEAFRWTATNGMVGLGDLPGSGAFTSDALGVSADGGVIVGQSRRSFPAIRAFRWTAATGMTELGDLPGGANFSTAWAVSPEGGVVVGSSSSAAGEEAFYWTQTTGMLSLGDLPGGGVNSRALAVSPNGKVVVGIGTSANGQEAFRWTQAGGMVGLGSLNPFDFASRASGVSADGNVVVGIGSGVSDFNGEAFVWFPGTGMLNLRDYLLAHGITAVQGWKLTDASSVSADGRTLCGIGVNPQGQSEGWVAHIEIDNTLPPSPPVDTTEVLTPTGFSVLSGTLVSGGVTQLQSSDNTYLTVRSIGQAPMQISLTGRASRSNASELRFTIEAAAEGSTTRQEVALFDFMAGTWVPLNTKTATTTDTTVEVRTTDRPTRFLEPGTLRVQARVTFVPSGGRKVTTRGRVDRVFWTRTP